MIVLYTKHPDVATFVKEQVHIDHVLPSFFREHLCRLPRESLVIGNLPIPSVAQICAAGHHYQHVIIPRARHGGLALSELRKHASLVEFHVAEID